MKRAALVVAIMLIAAAAGYGLHAIQRGGGAVALSGFEFDDLEGRPRRLGEWQGKPVLINFWATWCPPCREEIPLFIEAQQRLGDRGLHVVGIAIDQAEAVVRYRDTTGIGYPLLLGGAAGMEAMARLGNSRGALPYTVAIDGSGRVVATKLGAYQPAELEKLLQALVGSGQPPAD